MYRNLPCFTIRVSLGSNILPANAKRILISHCPLPSLRVFCKVWQHLSSSELFVAHCVTGGIAFAWSTGFKGAVQNSQCSFSESWVGGRKYNWNSVVFKQKNIACIIILKNEKWEDNTHLARWSLILAKLQNFKKAIENNWWRPRAFDRKSNYLVRWRN